MRRPLPWAWRAIEEFQAGPNIGILARWFTAYPRKRGPLDPARAGWKQHSARRAQALAVGEGVVSSLRETT